jgi:hypothetical protein
MAALEAVVEQVPEPAVSEPVVGPEPELAAEAEQAEADRFR